MPEHVDLANVQPRRYRQFTRVISARYHVYIHPIDEYLARILESEKGGRAKRAVKDRLTLRE